MAKRKLMKNKNSKKNEELTKNLVNDNQQPELLDEVEEVEEETGFWSKVPKPVKTGLKVVGGVAGAIGVFALGMLAGGRKADADSGDWDDFQQLDDLGLISSDPDTSVDEGP